MKHFFERVGLEVLRMCRGITGFGPVLGMPLALNRC